MSSSEEIKQQLWFVIQKIKINCIQNNLNVPIQYVVNLMDSHDEMGILKELADIGAIKIIQRRLMKDLLVVVTLSIQLPFLQINESFKQSRTYSIENNSNILENKNISECLDKIKGTFSKHQGKVSDKQEHLPIKVFVPGLNESIRSLRQPKSPEYSRPKFPYKIPAGTEWENFFIKFLDEERIDIRVKGLKLVTDYIEMGMVGKGKVPKPSEQWNFLKVLAKCHGEISIKDPEAKDVYKKHKSGLSKTLREYFSIDYDPFQPYHSTKEKSGNSYKIKITLIPPPERTAYKKEIHHDDADPLGIREYLNKIAPHI